MNNLLCLVYHEIDNDLKTGYSVSESQISEHLKLIKEQDLTVVTTNDLETSNNGKLLNLSFDDGADSDYKIVMPILEELNFKATFFITTGYIGKSGYMDWEQVKVLKKKGFDVQSHTRSHPLLGTLNKEKIKEELKTSKEIIEDKLGVEVKAISLPGGSFNKSVLETAFNCGYKYVFTSIPGLNSLGSNVYNRLLITQKTSLINFKKNISCDQLYIKKERLIYQIRNSLKKIIGPKIYYSLWRNYYK